jgi:hypothetical protein
LQAYATEAIKNALYILTSLLSFFANLFLVIIISFIIALDGPKIRKVILRNLIPKQYHEGFHFFTESVDRTFGGFIRGQILQGFMVGLGTAFAMTVLGLEFRLDREPVRRIVHADSAADDPPRRVPFRELHDRPDHNARGYLHISVH